MKYGSLRALLWAVAFLTAASAPMFLAYVGEAPVRDFAVEVGVALGFVGFGLLGLQCLLTGRYQQVATSFGLDSLLQFHRQVGLVAIGFVLAHPVVLFLVEPAFLEYLDPRVNLPRALGLTGVVGALLLIGATSLWRLAFRLQYEWWRLLHGVLALFILLVGTAHILQVGHYVAELWKQGLFLAMGVGAMALVVNTRVIRPWRNRNRPYRVEEVREERGDASTLVLRAEGHEGMGFRPGQFAWITLGPTPFSLQQHPYSFSSSADAAPERIAFTIKPEGDFSGEVHRTPVGSRAYLEGPFGYFVPDADPGMGCVMIAGGVGITPFMSMLRTLADRKDPRKLRLIYANIEPDQVIFFEELEELKSFLHLEVVHVMEDPPDGWEGERGLLDRELLERHLPTDAVDHEYFICGPGPMMDIAEPALLELGIPRRRVFSERFDMV